MKKPINTADQHPAVMMLSVMAGGSDGAIERQEAQGQRSFVASDTLPVEIDKQEDLEAAGVKFLGPVEGDELFQYVELPEGWRREPTDHAMWSKLVDAEGHERASIFYKAAFYDRAAHAHVTCIEKGGS